MNEKESKLDALAKRLAEKEFELPTELASGIIFLIVALVVWLLMPSQIIVSESDMINGRAFPTLLVAVMAICSIALIGKELYNVLIKKRPVTTKKVNLFVELKALCILGILFLFYFVSKITDLFVAGGLVCCLGFLLYFRCRKPSYYAITLTAAVLIWAAFRFGLNVKF